MGLIQLHITCQAELRLEAQTLDWDEAQEVEFAQLDTISPMCLRAELTLANFIVIAFTVWLVLNSH
jgi:hypothetical protein